MFGSKNESANAGLWIIVGGEKEAFDKVKPVLETLSETVHHMGDVGKGASMKLVGNLIVAAQLEALGEAMILATKAGLNPRDVLDVLHVTDFRLAHLRRRRGARLLSATFPPRSPSNTCSKTPTLIARFGRRFEFPHPRHREHPRDHQGGGQRRLGRGERLGDD